ncbi:MAG TPA: phosphoribosylanthranilate isomerase [Methylovirgula sp.]|nr:phosphoribosylanthranilate isomerase [Methylovirgula sp.]
MSVIVKICGLSMPDTVEAAIAAGADLLGFVRCAQSPRHISLDLARALGAQVGGRVRKVLVTSDASDAELAAAIAALEPDLLQLHGEETAERVGALKMRFGLPVIKAIGIGGAADLKRVAAYNAADWLLLDSRRGGSGTAFDWSLLGGLDLRKPWLLAGGLTPENVAAALAATRAPGVDVSSGVESARGVKDVAKIAAFVGKARAARLGSAGESG